MFAKLGGPAALLKLRHSRGYVGFASLATLLLRHVLEDDDTIRISMDRVGVALNVAVGGKRLTQHVVWIFSGFTCWGFSF